jgi:sugar phosphate isomerase/epimerase
MRVVGKRYDDLPGAIELMERLWQDAVVDGFEFQNLAEWDARCPPRDEAEKRLAAWTDSSRYTVAEMASLLRAAGVPILSVHANRDVGVCLCAADEQDVARGRVLLGESLALARAVGAKVCVFHLWDTWRDDFDLALLHRALGEAAARVPGVKASVENVPTHLAGRTPFELVRDFEWITLDLQWAALYDELDRFEALKDRIANLHLRGRLAGGRWHLDGAPFGFYEALRTIRDRWGYRGPLTVEPKGLRPGEMTGLAAAMASLRSAPG